MVQTSFNFNALNVKIHTEWLHEVLTHHYTNTSKICGVKMAMSETIAINLQSP